MVRRANATSPGAVASARTPIPTVERFTASIDFDRALARYDLRLSIAHAEMLGSGRAALRGRTSRRCGAGSPRSATEIESGQLPVRPVARGHPHERRGAAARADRPASPARLHTGRSRNDQVATDLALYLRDAARAARAGLHELQEVLLARAREHVDTVLPGYTHLQRAQPVRLAHHWLAFVEMFGARRASASRDLARAASRSRRSARARSPARRCRSTATPPRARSASRARRATAWTRSASRDAALEFLAAGAIAQVHLSRLAEELVLWSTAEFGFVELADAYSTGSSLMPQKKNPDVPELVRGKAGRAIGNLVALLTVLKGLPLTYNRDLQEDKEPIFDTARTLRDSLEVMAGAIATLRVNDGAHARRRERPDAARDRSRRGARARGRAVPRGARGGRADRRALRREGRRPALALARGPARVPSRVPGRRRPSCSRSSARSRAARCRAPRRAPRVVEALDAAEAELAGRARDAGVLRESGRPTSRARTLRLWRTLLLACSLRGAAATTAPPVRARGVPRRPAGHGPAGRKEPKSDQRRPPPMRPAAGARSPMSRELPFTKMHGAGNDFVVLDGLRDALPPLEPLAARLVRPPPRDRRRPAARGAARRRARTSAWRSGTRTARRWRCARTGSARSTSTCATPATPTATRSASRRSRASCARAGRAPTASPSTWAARSSRPRRSRPRSARGDGPGARRAARGRRARRCASRRCRWATRTR